MESTEVLLFAETDRVCPFLQWVDSLPPAAQLKCIVRVERLEAAGPALSDARCSHVADGIRQLSFRCDGVEYAILYFFHKQKAVIVHGCMVSSRLANSDFALAGNRKLLFCDEPGHHTF